jgi:hypothetical protein
MHRADKLVWLLYVAAGLAALAIFAPLMWPKTATFLAMVTLLFSFVALGTSGYIAYAGGKVRHREFRNELAPSVPPEHDEH